jgi:hypothetical protein
MTLVAVKLTDNEWRVKCEELAQTELLRKERREELAEEAEEWKERKKVLEARIDSVSDRCEALAQEVSTRETMRDAQTELPLQPTDPEPLRDLQQVLETIKGETVETPRAQKKKHGRPVPDSAEPPAEIEPGSEG